MEKGFEMISGALEFAGSSQFMGAQKHGRAVNVDKHEFIQILRVASHPNCLGSAYMFVVCYVFCLGITVQGNFNFRITCTFTCVNGTSCSVFRLFCSCFSMVFMSLYFETHNMLFMQ